MKSVWEIKQELEFWEKVEKELLTWEELSDFAQHFSLLTPVQTRVRALRWVLGIDKKIV